jgi:hypothetical protein
MGTGVAVSGSIVGVNDGSVVAMGSVAATSVLTPGVIDGSNIEIGSVATAVSVAAVGEQAVANSMAHIIGRIFHISFISSSPLVHNQCVRLGAIS